MARNPHKQIVFKMISQTEPGTLFNRNITRHKCCLFFFCCPEQIAAVVNSSEVSPGMKRV